MASGHDVIHVSLRVRVLGLSGTMDISVLWFNHTSQQLERMTRRLPHDKETTLPLNSSHSVACLKSSSQSDSPPVPSVTPAVDDGIMSELDEDSDDQTATQDSCPLANDRPSPMCQWAYIHQCSTGAFHRSLDLLSTLSWVSQWSFTCRQPELGCADPRFSVTRAVVAHERA